MTSNPSFAIGTALRVIDDAWAELRRGAGWGAPPLNERASLPNLSFEEAERRAAVGMSIANRIAALDLTQLPHELALTVRFASTYAARWQSEAAWYWTVQDSLGVGFFGLFGPTSYAGGHLLGSLSAAFTKMKLRDEGDLDRYLGFVSDYVRLLRQMLERTRGQAARGIYMPQAQLAQAVPLLTALKQRACGDMAVDAARLPPGAQPGFLAELQRRIDVKLVPAFDAFVEILGGDYARHAPETVGMAQYPDGPAIYAALVRDHTTLDVTPAEVHAIGLERMAQIRADMASVRREVKFDGDDFAYRAALDAMPSWRAGTADEVTRLFRVYIERIKPRLADYFSLLPAAAHDAAPLPDALAGSMSFGFYDPPLVPGQIGRYLYNARNLTQRGLFNVGALNYHELMPGHHLHFCSQQENEALHPLRRNGFINAFNEGWAEYAATLAGEMGMYEQPAERFGRLVMDAFLTCRLVVDTGMNALGWSLERARDYMRANAFLSEAEIRTETVRYSCDIPGQSLAYKLGDVALMRLRTKMRDALGAKFDIKHFHDTVLRPGALPLSLVETEVDRAIAAA